MILLKALKNVYMAVLHNLIIRKLPNNLRLLLLCKETI